MIFVILRFYSWFCKSFCRSNIFFNSRFTAHKFSAFICVAFSVTTKSNFSPSTSRITSQQRQYEVQVLFKLLLSDSRCTLSSVEAGSHITEQNLNFRSSPLSPLKHKTLLLLRQENEDSCMLKTFLSPPGESQTPSSFKISATKR